MYRATNNNSNITPKNGGGEREREKISWSIILHGTLLPLCSGYHMETPRVTLLKNWLIFTHSLHSSPPAQTFVLHNSEVCNISFYCHIHSVLPLSHVYHCALTPSGVPPSIPLSHSKMLSYMHFIDATVPLSLSQQLCCAMVTSKLESGGSRHRRRCCRHDA